MSGFQSKVLRLRALGHISETANRRNGRTTRRGRSILRLLPLVLMLIPCGAVLRAGLVYTGRRGF